MYRLLLFRRYNALNNKHHGIPQHKPCATRALHQQVVQFAGVRNDRFLSQYMTARGLITYNFITAQTRQQSTLPTNAEEALEKKNKYKKVSYLAKYADLLEVTNGDVSERQSRIKRLQSKKLQKFITKTQQQILDKRAKIEDKIRAKEKKTEIVQPVEYQKINMEAFDHTILESGVYDDKPLIFFGKNVDCAKQILEDKQRVENILKSFHNYRNIIESIEHERHETDISLERANHYNLKHNITDCDGVETSEPYVLPDIRGTPALTKIHDVEAAVTKKSKSRFKSKTYNTEEQERQAKERALRVNLQTYLNICVSTGLLNRGISTLHSYRHRARKHSTNLLQNIITIDLYNILLHGLAEKGAFERYREIFQMIQEDELKFNEQTYAAIFECLGRLEMSNENSALIAKYINQAEKEV